MTFPADQSLAAVSDCRVLVIDDDPASTALVRRTLARAGLPQTVEIHDPTLVRSALPTIAPDLVILDLKMPLIDGFAVFESVQQYAAGTYLPVIVVTVDDSREALKRALGMGAADFVNKPFDPIDVTLRVRNLLLQRKSYEEMRRNRAWLRQRLDVFESGSAWAGEDPDAVRDVITSTMAADQVDIVFQPVIDMRVGSILGYEALSRFPETRLGGTQAWFVAADQVGLVTDLELHCLRRAVAALPLLPEGTFLSLNVSPGTIMSGAGLVEAIGDQPWDRVVIELTEHVPVEDYDTLLRGLAPLRERGARLAIDDAGAGFASLRHVIGLLPDIIKLDISLVRGVDHDVSRMAISEMLIRFSSRLGAQCICEGVETQEERAALLRLGASWGQGFLLGRPTALDQLPDLQVPVPPTYDRTPN